MFDTYSQIGYYYLKEKNHLYNKYRVNNKKKLKIFSQGLFICSFLTWPYEKIWLNIKKLYITIFIWKAGGVGGSVISDYHEWPMILWCVMSLSYV